MGKGDGIVEVEEENRKGDGNVGRVALSEGINRVTKGVLTRFLSTEDAIKGFQTTVACLIFVNRRG